MSQTVDTDTMDIDVVLPTLDPDMNQLRRAVSSIVSQRGVTTNLIIVDDSEHDAVKKYAASASDEIRYIRGPGTTLAEALNTGVDAGNSQLVARQDADDLSSSSRLRTQYEHFQENSSLDLLGTGATIVRPSGDETTRRVKQDLDAEDFKHGNPIVHGSVMFRRDAFDNVGGYDSRFPTSEDIELWLRMVNNGLRLKNIDSALYQLSLHADSIYADQLWETKLWGEFARDFIFSSIEKSVEENVIEDGNIQAYYESMSAEKSARFHQEVATELIRYGRTDASREHISKSWTENGLNPARAGLFALSFAPNPVINGAVKMGRKLKNRRIVQENGK